MAMLWRLYGMRDATIFQQEWAPLVSNIVYNGANFNWVTIMSSNMKKAIVVVKPEDPQLISNFFMYSYLMDACCAYNHFQYMKWTWNPWEAPIHMYCGQMWESKHKSKYDKISNDFVFQLHRLLTGRPTYYMSKNARLALSEIGDWFVTEKLTYIVGEGV